VTETKLSTLVGLVVGFALLGYLLSATAYSSLPELPPYAPVSLVLLTIAELGMARVVREQLAHRSRPRARPLHPMQVARAAALAKASSTAGAVLLGVYAGVLAWTLPRGAELLGAGRDALVAGLSALSCLALVAAALVLERSCRVPEDPQLGSRA